MKLQRTTATILVLTAVLVSSCSKEEAAAPPAPEAAPVASQPAAAPVAAPAPIKPSTDASASIAAAQAAMQSQEYEQAAAALLAAQRSTKPLTAEQGQAVHNQMLQLQQNLANAIANGDPKAKAAAALLRQSTMR